MHRISKWIVATVVVLLRFTYFLWPIAVGYVAIEWSDLVHLREVTNADWFVAALTYGSYVLLLALWKIPLWQTTGFDKHHSLIEVAEVQDAFRRTIAQVAGGAALLVGLYFTWANLLTAEQGQITERFTRAVDQLGSRDMAIRMGGVYGLERIARDSRVDHGPVFEILSAFVRNNSYKDKTQSTSPTPGPDSLQSDLLNKIRPREDIQAVLTVIGRREIRHQESSLDLRNTFLRGAKLVAANLSKADLSQVDLKFSNLSDADLSFANFAGANLHRTQLNGTNLSSVVLSGSDLSQADLSKANLQGALLESVVVTDALFWGARLENAILRDVDFSEAIGLTESQLKTALIERNVRLPPGITKKGL